MAKKFRAASIGSGGAEACKDGLIREALHNNIER